uniref:hypothetical protein n=1 Tax=Nocardia jejuensis TaxID=328049 RepID=UPI00082EFBBB
TVPPTVSTTVAPPVQPAPPTSSAPAQPVPPATEPAPPASTEPAAPLDTVAPTVPLIPAPPIDPAAPAATTPASAAPLFTLTAMPNGWQSRTDLHPALEVRGDGRAVKWVGNGQQVNGTIAAEVVSAAAVEVRALALLDMGMPSVSDQGTMIIDFMPPAPDQDVHAIVYAPEWSDGLTDDQKAARGRFAELFQRLLNAFAAA